MITMRNKDSYKGLNIVIAGVYGNVFMNYYLMNGNNTYGEEFIKRSLNWLNG